MKQNITRPNEKHPFKKDFHAHSIETTLSQYTRM